MSVGVSMFYAAASCCMSHLKEIEGIEHMNKVVCK